MANASIKAKSIFDFLTCLFQDKIKWEDLSDVDKKAFSPYMINRFISMHPDFVGVVNYLQQYTISGMNSKEVYKLYLDLLPKQKFFAKYIKSKREETDKISPNLIEFISTQENWSTDETFDNISFILSTDMGCEVLRDYLKLFGISADDAKKIYKIN